MVRVKLVSKYPISYAIDREKVEVTADGRSGFVSVTSRADIASNKFVIESDYVNVESEVAFGKKIPTDGLVLEFPIFEGAGTVLHDTSGNNNNGTIYGAVWKELPTGKYALSFDGKDDYCEVNLNKELLEFSIIMWYRLTREPFTFSEWWHYTVSCYYNGFRLECGYYSNSPYHLLKVWCVDGSSEAVFLELSDTDYHCVVYRVKSNEFIQLDIWDKELTDSKSLPTHIRPPVNLYIGGFGSKGNLPAEIGLMLVYSKILSDKKIEKIYKTTAPLFGIEV